MFSTTLRIDDELGAFLQAAAKRQSLSVNAFLAALLAQERQAAARQRLASDWAAYAQDAEAQDVDYALTAQASVAAESQAKPYGTRKPAKKRS